MESASRVPVDVSHKQQGPVEPIVAGPTIDTTAATATTTTATGQSQTSPGYLQSARETLASIAGTVQNAVGIETPASTLHGLADNAKIDASMPSSETSGAKPGERVGGVGALPGSNKEEGIARLPAERVSLPSQEYEGAHPGDKSGGVGPLPGHLSESNVALLPEERGTQVKEGVESSARAALHTSERTDKQDLKTAAAHPIETAKQARRESTSSSSSSEGERDPNAPKRKTTFKNKVAGGVKTAMGKLKKDEEMIAEGNTQRGH
ncbi:unnamed protein product [Rhizoctonia solani]|uniref:Uncharacterized protein n=1 Tax=Rhizoctonia solani TaxID=456999 RepID=A0A8H3DM85_9AGAM|nr:unnamed protein product [Rhizoctonia solani]